MVFGYQTPQGTGTDHDFFIFSWKQGAQSGDANGFSLERFRIRQSRLRDSPDAEFLIQNKGW